MAFEGLRSRLRSMAGGDEGDGREEGERPISRAEARELARRGAGAVRRQAPSTELERGRNPRSPTSSTTREEIAERLQVHGQIRPPIPGATLETTSDPRYMEALGRGDAGNGGWVGDEPAGDPYQAYFGGGSPMPPIAGGPFVQEVLDERDHEGGIHAYDDEHEESVIDDPMAVDDPFGVMGGMR